MAPRCYFVQDNKVIVKRLISDVKVEVKKMERWKWMWWGVVDSMDTTVFSFSEEQGEFACMQQIDIN